MSDTLRADIAKRLSIITDRLDNIDGVLADIRTRIDTVPVRIDAARLDLHTRLSQIPSLTLLVITILIIEAAAALLLFAALRFGLRS